MQTAKTSVLIVGESDVGKTHYGAQLLKRLISTDGKLRMNGAATNLQPFEAALQQLNEGRLAGHTAAKTYVESVWPIRDDRGEQMDLVWPDYGGEQIKAILENRRIGNQWRERVASCDAWVWLIRLTQTAVNDDIFSRPLKQLKAQPGQSDKFRMSDQSRLIELLQMLLYVREAGMHQPLRSPVLMLLLSCWDELNETSTPEEVLRKRLPLLADFVSATWDRSRVHVFGISALGRALDKTKPDPEYAASGPEKFGYVVYSDGSASPDLTIPISMLMTVSS